MKKIVIIEDNSTIRNILKGILSEYGKIYTSDNGVQGLGFVYLIKPDLIIVDSTLPKYNGLEIVDYLSSHLSLNESNVKIIVVHEGGSIPKIPSDYILIDKREKDFIFKIESIIQGDLEEKNNSLKMRMSSLIIKIANKGDLLMHKIKSENKIPFFGQFFDFFRWIVWFIIQIVLSINLTYFFIRFGKPKEENIEQNNKDLSNLRVKTYPTLITLFVSILFLLIQVFLFIFGGVVILNTKIESIFASSETTAIK